MASPTTRVATADREAAAWHARLGVRSVSTETIEEFFAWRRTPENAEAYRRVEKTWAASARLAGRPGIEAAVAEAMDRGRAPVRKFRSPRLLLGAGAVTAVLGLAIGAWVWSEARAVVATDVGEQRVVRLADGSQVRLDTGSTIRVRFDGDRRRVELRRGQAMFHVAHDAERPFVVGAGGTEVTAVGTVFDVRRLDGGVRVTLVSGAVEVKPEGDAAPARLRAGQQTQVTPAGMATRSVDVAAATSWTGGRLVFEDASLASAVAEVNRYLAAPIVLASGDLGDTPVNGVFRTGDRDAFAAAAAEGLGLTSTLRPDGSLLLSRRTKKSTDAPG